MSTVAPPDRACINKGHRFYFRNTAAIGVSIDGVDQAGTVVEYCVSGSWARCYELEPGTLKPKRNVLGNGYAIHRVHGVITVRWK